MIIQGEIALNLKLFTDIPSVEAKKFANSWRTSSLWIQPEQGSSKVRGCHQHLASAAQAKQTA